MMPPRFGVRDAADPEDVGVGVGEVTVSDEVAPGDDTVLMVEGGKVAVAVVDNMLSNAVGVGVLFGVVSDTVAWSVTGSSHAQDLAKLKRGKFGIAGIGNRKPSEQNEAKPRTRTRSNDARAEVICVDLKPESSKYKGGGESTQASKIDSIGYIAGRRQAQISLWSNTYAGI
ncbi:hypothetical protein AG1IA_04009 [Rhizoctonia solani AG-1 IA]|uniref:Uncharacterized protein n=1 Tax=Thanatephorus cucumeris (strain AG1-IA) TaxID=983506 RepID=L8WV00_THACA|nr:hypothetical protein AG1IA_04009 [Rhizoctonia solani AG-1 IA]